MNTPIPNKPEWLAKLEEESWQAELIISGAAIFGCLLLPDFLKGVEIYVQNTVNREGMLLWYGIMLFANMLAYTLIITFILHFSMRALWIGMVGFNSAYPTGFIPNKSYSESFQEQLREEFGDTNGYISRLDRTCSTIFGAGFAVALMSLGYVLIMTLMALVLFWLNSYLPKAFQWAVIIGFFSLIFIYSILNGVMTMDSMKEKAWVKRLHFPLNKAVSKVMMNIGYRPASYVMNVLSSDASKSKYGMLLVFVVSGTIGSAGAAMGASNLNVSIFIDDVYHRMSDNAGATYPDHYLDTRSDKTVYRPAISSYEIHPGQLFSIFMPLPNRERYEMESQCNLPEATGKRFSSELRNARRKRDLECAQQYYRFYINDQELTDYDLTRHYNGAARQFGYLATVFEPDFKAGKNILRTESNYFNSDGAPRVANIVFYYFPDGSRHSGD